MPVPGQRNPLLAVRPGADDFIQLHRHEDAQKSNNKVHINHLPQRPKLNGIMEECREFLEKTGTGNTQFRQPLACNFAPAKNHQ